MQVLNDDLPIALLPRTFDVSRLVSQIDANPSVWDGYKARTAAYGTPHGGVSDIWVRYNAWKNFNGDMADFNGPHSSEWYPVVEHIPAVIRLCLDVLEYVGDTELGGVLITRVPPGGEVKPHVDGGWHAGHYRKHAVQLRGNQKQGFFFVGHEVRAEPGQVYAFDNSKVHFVKNESDSDRMTLIICSRGNDE